MILRPLALFLGLAALAACARNDLADPPVPLGDFALGLNIAVADNIQMVPISRPAEPADWEAAIEKAVEDRFGETRYQGTKLYNIGINIDAYALAPPGIPLVASPKSVVVITANIWDDGAEKKLNEEGKQFTVFEGLSGETMIGSGLTKSKKQQMETLAFNAVKRVEDWLLEHPEWFGLTPEALKAALEAREAEIAAARKTKPAEPAAAPAEPPPAEPPLAEPSPVEPSPVTN
jgi:hypothetical protein